MGETLVTPVNDVWVLAESGPMRLLVAAWDGDKPLHELAHKGGERACGLLAELAPFQSIISKKASATNSCTNLPKVVKEMIAAVQNVGDVDLTPLAAVAGTISDLVAQHVFSHGATRVIVDNGGDIAVRMTPDAEVKVGIRLDVESHDISHGLRIAGGMGVGGVTTSGLGGRSFTKGVAQSAVVLGPTASIADAASTSVANATLIDSPNVRRIKAEDLYPDTDLRGEEVTLEVGDLTPGEIDLALSRGMERVQYLMNKEVISGALICVKGKVVWSHALENLLFPVA